MNQKALYARHESMENAASFLQNTGQTFCVKLSLSYILWSFWSSLSLDSTYYGGNSYSSGYSAFVTSGSPVYTILASMSSPIRLLVLLYADDRARWLGLPTLESRSVTISNPRGKPGGKRTSFPASDPSNPYLISPANISFWIGLSPSEFRITESIVYYLSEMVVCSFLSFYSFNSFSL